MDPRRFARVRELFLTARSLPTESRAAYLARECGTDELLRREVESLFDQPTGTGRILTPDGPAGEISRQLLSAIPAPPTMPEQIGAYRILGVLGTGGMGIVYRALQKAPIRREVALKLARGDIGGLGVAARFEAERQVLAQMEHPNIARVLEAGADEAGRPYFVMELVRGVPITEFCEANSLELRERLELLRPVCLAVQHAHQKGIIHRDLKPSNILVTIEDEAPCPKLIDFGVAKAVNEPTEQAAALTREGQLIGTLEYMSPEQIEGGFTKVDARSDIYALGVVLYELVSGELPYDIRGRPALEALKTIIAKPPQRLAGRVTRSGRLDGELEAIVLKALAKEPDRRYTSAGALAEDLERYLTKQPILARPPTAVYQLSKLVARHTWACAAAMAVLLLLVGFAVAMSVQREIAVRERRSAEAVSGFLQGLLSGNHIEQHGKDVTLVDVLAVGSGLVDQLAAAPQAQAEVQRTLGEAYYTLGLYEEAELHMRASLSDLEAASHDDPLRLVNDVNALAELLVHRGKFAAADTLLRQALAFEASVGDSGRIHFARSKNLLANALARGGRAAEAEPLHRAAVETCIRALGDTAEIVASFRNDLAVFLWEQGKLAEADPLYRQAIETYRRLHGDCHTDVATIIANHAVLLTEMGRLREAEAAHRATLACRRSLLGDEHAMIGLGLMSLGVCLESQAKYLEAAKECRTGGEILRRSLGEDHPWTGLSLWVLARNHHACGHYAEAESLYKGALATQRRIHPPGHREIAETQVWLAMLWLDTGRTAEAEPALREGLVALQAALPAGHWSVGVAQNAWACCLGDQGRLGEADSLWEQSRARVLSAPPFAKRPCLERTAALLERLGRGEVAAAWRAAIPRPEVTGTQP